MSKLRVVNDGINHPTVYYSHVTHFDQAHQKTFFKRSKASNPINR
jgi:hypothetical protein